MDWFWVWFWRPVGEFFGSVAVISLFLIVAYLSITFGDWKRKQASKKQMTEKMKDKMS